MSEGAPDNISFSMVDSDEKMFLLTITDDKFSYAKWNFIQSKISSKWTKSDLIVPIGGWPEILSWVPMSP